MRYKEIDIFKGILTIQMVMAHCMQFFVGLKPGMWQYALSEYINLTTFSGFMFAYGFVSWHAYIGKAYGDIWPRIIKNILRMLAAYYISALSFRIFIENMVLDKKRILDVLLLRPLAGWSEFLLSFVAVMVLILCFQPLMKRAGKYLPLIIAIISVAACVMPLRTQNAVAATFLGRADFAVFAVVPYCLYFALGVLAAQNDGRIPTGFTILSSLGTVLFLGVLTMRGLPSRFPLSLPWLFGALGFVCLYYRASGLLIGFERIYPRFLENIGANSLYYLLLSNIFIFTLKSSRFYKLDTFYAFAVFIIIMAAIRYLHSITVYKSLSAPTARKN